jgi:uncharacterized protein with FMN-binding domain
MRRAPLVLSATAAGLGAVLSYHAQPKAPVGVTTGATATTATATSTPAAKTGGGGAAAHSATGAAVANRYGVVQVKVTVSGGKITSVTALQLPQQDPKSTQISQYAAPQLANEVLSAQGTRIDGVSGASYTTQSYETSLQSALDKLGYSQS